MSNITKPTDINKIWAASGDILTPSDTKISTGWQVEIPPRQTFNYIDNRQDQSIAHINQHGIAVWDSVTEYQANTSYTQGSDGVVYKALVTNTNVNPVGTTGTWQVAFAAFSNGATKSSTAQAQAQTDDSTYITPLKLVQALQGANQQFASSGYQKFPGGLIIQWGQTAGTDATGFAAQTLPITFPVAHFQAVCIYASGTRNAIVTQIASLTTTQIQVFASTSNTGAAVAGAIVKWIAVGV